MGELLWFASVGNNARSLLSWQTAYCTVVMLLLWSATLTSAVLSEDEPVMEGREDIPTQPHRLLQGGGGGGGGGVGVALGFIIISFFLVCSVCSEARAVKDTKEKTYANIEWVSEMSSHHESLQNNSRSNPSVFQFPSGKWNGYYTEFGYDHSLWSFDMTFHNRFPHLGTIQGFGEDDVGKYYIKNGLFNCRNGRLAFTKKYLKNKHFRRNLNRDIRGENLGHEVLYRGTVQGHLAAGVRGQWSVATYQYRSKGNFHIWPVSCHHSSSTPSRDVLTADVASGSASDETTPLLEAPSAPVQLTNEKNMVKRPADVYYISSTDTECAVCFDAGMDTVLRPCGHIAVCSTCAERLDLCPICRTRIDSRECYSYHVHDVCYVSSTDNECAVCFDASIDTALRPCGHFAVCSSCAERKYLCPICRTLIASRECYSCP
jgi:hypothetical protein